MGRLLVLLYWFDAGFRRSSRGRRAVIAALVTGLPALCGWADESGCAPPAPGMISWWKADGDAVDQLGAHDGTTPFGIAYGDGVVGQAFDFDGSTRRVSVPDSPEFKLTNAMTLEAWVYPRAYQGFITFRGDNRSGLDTWTLDAYQPGLVNFQIDDEANDYAGVQAPLELNQWQHVAATWDRISGDMKLYINGTLAGQTNTPIIPIGDLNSEAAVGIGNHGGTLHQFPFNGLIDELAIYARALTSNEIAALYDAGSAGKCSVNPPLPTQPPRITGFSPPAATPGSILTLSGTNFSPVAARNIVHFGAVQTTVLTATTTQLTVTVPTGATYAPITVHVDGLVAYAPTPFQPSFSGDGSHLGASSLAARFDLPGGDGAHRSAIADLDGDGKPDLAVADVYGHTISLYRSVCSPGVLNTSSFEPRVILPAEGGTSDNPYGFATADVDGDGRLDLVACDRLGNNISVYRNVATPGNLAADSFAPHVNFPVGADPRYARVADLDGDGRADIVSCNYAANTISLLRNIGSAGTLNSTSFAPSVNLPAGVGPYDVAIGDLDGDGRPDLAVVNQDGFSMSVYQNLAVPGTLDGASFAPRVDFPAPNGNDTIAFGDVDGDGRPDLVIGSYKSYSLSVFRNDATPGLLDTNSFASRVDFATGNWTHTVALADLNGDQRPDIITVGELASYLSVFENRSSPGAFDNGSLFPRVDFGAGWNAWGVSAGDLDLDGRPDLVFCNAYDDTVSIYHNLSPLTNLPPPTETRVLVDGTTPGYYNSALGTVLDGTAPQFPLPLGQGDDPLIYPSEEPDLTAAAGVLGNWLAPVPELNANWQFLSTIPATWEINTETAIIYEVDGGSTGFTSLRGDFDADNGLFVWVNGQYQFGAVAPGLPSPTGQFEYTNVNLGALSPGVNYIQVLREDSGVATGYQIRVTGTTPSTNPPPPVVANLLFNGDFEMGNTGFESDYPSPPSGTTQPGEYVVGADPQAVNGFWAAYGDHTSGSGLMMLVDGALTPNQNVWRQTVSVLPNAQYTFSAWAASSYSGASPVLQLFINGQHVTPDMVLGNQIGVWQPFEITWNSGEATEAVLEIRDSVTDYLGNDFALDDLSFQGPPPPASPPTIVHQPEDQTVPAGESARFDVEATGASPLTYQWLFEEEAIPGETNPSLALTDVQLSQAGEYAVTVSNAYGSVTSSNALLTVQTFPPMITAQPQNRTVYEGKTVSFSVEATGTAPLRFQWFKDNSPVPDDTNATLTLSNVQLDDAGLYSVRVTNHYGSEVSQPAELTVLPPPVCVPAPEGVVGWWPGESNTWDVAGGFDASVSAYRPPPSALLYATGLVGSAFNFVPSWNLLLPTVPELDLGAGDGFTFEAWIHPDSVSSTFGLFGWGGSGPGGPASPVGVNLRILNPGILQAYLVKTNQQTILLTSTPLAVQAKVWQHVALSCDNTSGDVVIYVDGVPVAQTNIGSVSLLTSGALRLGNAAGPSYYGLMDEPTLYSRALSQTEIQSIYVADEAGKCPPPPPPCVDVPGLVALWRGESNTLDSVAGNNATVLPAGYSPLLTYQAGQVGSAFAFRGPNCLSVPPSDSLDVGRGGGLTIEGWIYPQSSGGLPVVEWTDSNSFGVYLAVGYTGPGALEANLIDAAGGIHWFRSDYYLIAGPYWQHVALTYDPSSGAAALYLNGTSVATANLGSFVPRTDLPLLIGFHPHYTGPYVQNGPPTSDRRFYGAMDELAIYRRALNAQEIRELARPSSSRCLEWAPTIGRQPQDQIALEGGNAALQVTAGGSEPLQYQWFLGEAALQGANDPILVLENVQLTDAGHYSVVVSNAFGSVTSRPVRLTVLPANQCLPTPDGAVAFWRGESNTLDELATHDAEWGTGSQPAYSTTQTGGGKVGTAFRFNGASCLRVPANPDLDVAAGGGFTVEGWIKPDFLSGPQPLVDWNDGRGNVGVGIYYARTGPGVLEVTLTDTNGVSTDRMVTFATPTFTIGSQTNPYPSWTHVALTFDKVSGKAVLFVNAKPVAERMIGPIYTSPDYELFSPTTTGDLYFGWRPSGLYSGSTRFRGAVDEMTVYYRALTPPELQAIYVVGANGKCAPTPATCIPPAEGIVSWWRGESNVLDSVNDNHGLSSPTPLYGEGVDGLGIRILPGRHVRIPASASLDVAAGPGFTFETWVKPDNQGSYTIAAWNNGTGEPGVSLGSSVTRGSYYFEINFVDTEGNSHTVLSPYRAITFGVWQHLAVTYDKASGQAVLFLNGSPITVASLGSFTPRTTGDLFLGLRPPGPYPGSGWPFQGALDDTSVYNRALSAAEITALYRNPGRRCMELPVIVEDPQGLRVNVGSDVRFLVQAEGNPVLRYLWFRDGQVLHNGQTGALETDPALKLTHVTRDSEGAYHVQVTNAFGAVVSADAILEVNYPPIADASATLPLIISPNDIDATVVLDATLSSDPDEDPLAFFWYSSVTSQPATFLGTGAVAVVTLPVGTHTIDLVADDGLASDTNSIIVEVVTPAQAAEKLLAAVTDADTGNGQSVIASLSAALASIDRSNPIAAANQLRAFQNQVEAQVAPEDPELAADFIRQAQDIIDRLAGGVVASRDLKALANRDTGKVRLEFSGAAGATYIVEASNDMIHWVKIGVARQKGKERFEFEDPNTDKFPFRFYRLVTP